MNKDSQLLSIGVLGCGPIAQFAHFESCIKARNTRLYALCDQAPDLVERMAAIHQPEKTYADFADMLADPQGGSSHNRYGRCVPRPTQLAGN